jgi:hypothetical protein
MSFFLLGFFIGAVVGIAAGICFCLECARL